MTDELSLERAKRAMDERETFVPHHMRDGYYYYLKQGRPLGSFGTAIVEGDQEVATMRADSVNQLHIKSQLEWAKQHVRKS